MKRFFVHQKITIHRVVGILLLLFVVTRSFPFWTSVIPLWYDPGLYKSMFLAYINLESLWQLSALPNRIQYMYEPFLWLWWTTAIPLMVWWRHDSILTRWWVFIALLPILWIWLWAHRFWTRAWLFALLLAVTSFTQYQVFWWQYRKQAIGMFLLMVVLRWWERKARWQMIPLLSALFLVNRPAAVLIAFVWLIHLIILLIRREWKQIKLFVWSILIAFFLALPILFPFLKIQFAPLISLFIQHIDLPTLNEWFQASGTFLTTREYLLLSGVLLLVAIWWFVKNVTNKDQIRRGVFHTAWLVLVLRVFWQWFFFQRMIGYLDMFVIIFAGIICASLREWNGRKKWAVLLLIASQSGMLFYRWYRTYRPLIEPNEFAFLTQIGKTIEEDAVIIVPGIDYSPRVQWRTQREVLAPWLFDLNRWWNLDEQWTSNRLSATPQQKCASLSRDYPELQWRPVYLRQWLKQPETDLQWACFQLLQSKEWWSRWKMN